MLRPMRAAARLLSLATTLCVAVAAVASDRIVRDDAHHFGFEPPETWTPLDAKFLDDVRAGTAEMTKPIETATGEECDWSAIAAFGVRPDEDGRQTSCFMVGFQRWPSKPHSYTGIEKRFSKEVMSAGRVLVADLAATTVPEFGDVVVDRSRKRVTQHGSMTTADVGNLAMYTVGLLGTEGIVWLHAYARPEDAAAAWPLIDGVADSFRWDDGYEFREDAVADAVAGPTAWRDDPHRWSVTVPDGWTQRPPQPGDASMCVARFAPTNSEEGIDPVVVAGYVPAEFHSVSWAEFESGFTCDDLERIISRSCLVIGKTASQVECGRAVFDKHRGRMSATYSMEFAGLRRKGVLVNFFGRDGGAMFMCIAMEKDFAAAQPSFDALVDSFRFDDGYRWEDLFPFESIDWGSVGKSVALVVGIGAVGTVLGAVLVRIVRARQDKAARPRVQERLMRVDLVRRRD